MQKWNCNKTNRHSLDREMAASGKEEKWALQTHRQGWLTDWLEWEMCVCCAVAKVVKQRFWSFAGDVITYYYCSLCRIRKYRQLNLCSVNERQTAAVAWWWMTEENVSQSIHLTTSHHQRETSDSAARTMHIPFFSIKIMMNEIHI